MHVPLQHGPKGRTPERNEKTLRLPQEIPERTHRRRQLIPGTLTLRDGGSRQLEGILPGR